STVADVGLVEDAAVTYQHTIAYRRVLDDGVGADAAVRANARVAEELDKRLDHGVGSDFDSGIDDAGLGTEDGDSCGHQTTRRGGAHGSVEVHHLGDRIGAKHFIDSRSNSSDDALAFRDEKGSDVGEVELAAGVLVGEALEVG